MSVTIQNKLNPIFETIMLLGIDYEMDRAKEETVLKLNELGGDGEAIFRKHLKEFEKYASVFQKNRVITEGEDFYFKEVSLDFYITFTSLFFIREGFIDEIGRMDNEQLTGIIIENSEELFDKTIPDYSQEHYEDFIKSGSLIALVDGMQLSESEKWKTFLILRNPHEYYSRFAGIIKSNIPAYEKAYKAIEISIDKYIGGFIKARSKDAQGGLIGLDKELKGNIISTVIPSMALAAGGLISFKGYYYGLLLDKIYAEINKKGNGKEYLIGCLKALSDKSKLEILITLKSCPKYATELAEQLGITTATVSHHMSTLLTCEMIYLEKENGKIYYHVNDEAIRNILEQLRSILL